MYAKYIFGIILVHLLATVQVCSQATAYANIYAEVVDPIGIRNTSDLHTGEIVVSNVHEIPGTTMEENAKPASDIKFGQNGSVVLITFSLTDAIHSTFDLTLPSEKMAIGSGNSNMITVGNFNSNQTMVVTPQGKKRMITVAADFNIPDNQIHQNFQSQNLFPVTINYN